MSYYKTNFYQNPRPYDRSDMDEPVPGWGLHPSSYNSPRVGVGAVLSRAAIPSLFASTKISSLATKSGETSIQEVSDVPWYYWIGGSVALVGVAGFAYYKGWLG
jgi:hypothetical protein